MVGKSGKRTPLATARSNASDIPVAVHTAPKKKKVKKGITNANPTPQLTISYRTRRGVDGYLRTTPGSCTVRTRPHCHHVFRTVAVVARVALDP